MQVGVVVKCMHTDFGGLLVTVIVVLCYLESLLLQLYASYPQQHLKYFNNAFISLIVDDSFCNDSCIVA